MAAAGSPPDEEEVANIVSEYLTQLIFDSDCVLDVMSRTRSYADVADHCLQMALLGMMIAIDAG